jgi:hypothetical protein
VAQSLYGRRVRVTIAVPVSTPGDFKGVTTDTITVGGGDDSTTPSLRVVAEIHKDLQKDPNNSELTIYNLSPKTRGSLQTKGVKVTVEAGYAATGVSRIFIGDARTVDHVREGVDWLTKIRLGDGERSLRFARLSRSWSPGTGAGDVLRDLANATGLQVGNIPDTVANVTVGFDQGYSVQGPVMRSIDRLAKSIGYTVSVQDQTLQILLPGHALDAEVPEISPTTGLIGSPQTGTPEKKGGPALVEFRSLLQPTRPGAKVHLKSARYDSDVRVKKCSFLLDTHSENWYTDFKGTLI